MLLHALHAHATGGFAAAAASAAIAASSTIRFICSAFKSSIFAAASGLCLGLLRISPAHTEIILREERM